MKKNFFKNGCALLAHLVILKVSGVAQTLQAVQLDPQKRITSVKLSSGSLSLSQAMPIVSYEVDKKYFRSDRQDARVSCEVNWKDTTGLVYAIVEFKNNSGDTVELRNVMPLDKEGTDAYITGLGTHGLSRTHLFLPGKLPVNVIVPDNAWDLGYSSLTINGDQKIAMLTRRDRNTIVKGSRRRFETILNPGGSVQYKLYAEPYKGNWQNGLVKIFQEKMLYDQQAFNDSLYQRKDLKWIRHTYVLHLVDAWDKFYFDIKDGKYHLQEFLQRGKKLYGGDDIVSIWPTWPTLGLDQRNQFDLFRDLPGGTAAMGKQAALSRNQGTKFFICYNPWDESTRSENHFKGLSKLIAETSADGVVLDTKGESSRELQDAADVVRDGVIMYSEGMAVPKDMAGIVSGRVHNALYYAPMLNLNKLIKPEFTIYRVAELFKEKIRREFATSFFNGYGTEINIMAPGQPDWAIEQYKYLGRTTRILRENTHNFVSRGYTPIVPVIADSIWANKWELGAKTIYTIYSIIPQGFKGKLIEVQPATGFHYVDLWHHTLLEPKQKDNKWFIEASTDAFNASDLGTNNEGEVDCIARLPILLSAKLNGDELAVSSNGDGDEIRIWAGAPSYEKEPLKLKPGTHMVRISEHFDRFEGAVVIQQMKEGILMDEQVVKIVPGTARRVSLVAKTGGTPEVPAGMVRIPAGKFKFKATNGDEFIAYPKQDVDSTFEMPSCYMDKHPVTNEQFSKFLIATKYKPSDPANFLKHWKNGKIPAGQEKFPVVYISYEDARAYAKWAGKRLPTEIEWQYAAQTPALREWPWEQKQPVTRKLEYVTNTLTVSHLEGIDPSVSNLGDGKPHAVGSYPAGANPYGLEDLVGSVWQLTNDVYMSGSHRYIMMKGGSYFKPSSSWWYVQGGARELHYRQFLLRVSQGFERNATVGFRCIKDAK
ncbi:formylglycine-generating enzyme family protein [Flavihumibacter solisilvae]|uniref:formylglycine-generating enzyme family protein n=1 Tax=Flavihumibacter solisilvae TaxID=1349421 RepID=UPI000691EFFC|nr:SUMF1/EgtB/PvdO family nonheme iron enzyme [Flavihumibacter solisilvae]